MSPGGHQIECEPTLCPCGKDDQQNPGLHEEECCQQVQGGERSPLLNTSETTSGVLHLALGSLTHERCELTEASPEKGHKDLILKAWSIFHMRRG